MASKFQNDDNNIPIKNYDRKKSNDKKSFENILNKIKSHNENIKILIKNIPKISRENTKVTNRKKQDEGEVSEYEINNIVNANTEKFSKKDILSLASSSSTSNILLENISQQKFINVQNGKGEDQKNYYYYLAKKILLNTELFKSIKLTTNSNNNNNKLDKRLQFSIPKKNRYSKYISKNNIYNNNYKDNSIRDNIFFKKSTSINGFNNDSAIERTLLSSSTNYEEQLKQSYSKKSHRKKRDLDKYEEYHQQQQNNYKTKNFKYNLIRNHHKIRSISDNINNNNNINRIHSDYNSERNSPNSLINYHQQNYYYHNQQAHPNIENVNNINLDNNNINNNLGDIKFDRIDVQWFEPTIPITTIFAITFIGIIIFGVFLLFRLKKIIFSRNNNNSNHQHHQDIVEEEINSDNLKIKYNKHKHFTKIISTNLVKGNNNKVNNIISNTEKNSKIMENGNKIYNDDESVQKIAIPTNSNCNREQMNDNLNKNIKSDKKSSLITLTPTLQSIAMPIPTHQQIFPQFAFRSDTTYQGNHQQQQHRSAEHSILMNSNSTGTGLPATFSSSTSKMNENAFEMNKTNQIKKFPFERPLQSPQQQQQQQQETLLSTKVTRINDDNIYRQYSPPIVKRQYQNLMRSLSTTIIPTLTTFSSPSLTSLTIRQQYNRNNNSPKQCVGYVVENHDNDKENQMPTDIISKKNDLYSPKSFKLNNEQQNILSQQNSPQRQQQQLHDALLSSSPSIGIGFNDNISSSSSTTTTVGLQQRSPINNSSKFSFSPKLLQKQCINDNNQRTKNVAYNIAINSSPILSSAIYKHGNYFKFPEVDCFTPDKLMTDTTISKIVMANSTTTAEGEILTELISPLSSASSLSTATTTTIKPTQITISTINNNYLNSIDSKTQANRRARLKSISLDSDGAKLVEDNLGIPVEELIEMANQSPTLIDECFIYDAANADCNNSSLDILNNTTINTITTNVITTTSTTTTSTAITINDTTTKQKLNAKNVNNLTINIDNNMLSLSEKNLCNKSNLIDDRKLISENNNCYNDNHNIILQTPKTPTLTHTKQKAISLDSSDQNIIYCLPSINISNNIQKQHQNLNGQQDQQQHHNHIQHHQHRSLHHNCPQRNLFDGKSTSLLQISSISVPTTPKRHNLLQQNHNQQKHRQHHNHQYGSIGETNYYYNKKHNSTVKLVTSGGPVTPANVNNLSSAPSTSSISEQQQWTPQKSHGFISKLGSFNETTFDDDDDYDCCCERSCYCDISENYLEDMIADGVVVVEEEDNDGDDNNDGTKQCNDNTNINDIEDDNKKYGRKILNDYYTDCDECAENQKYDFRKYNNIQTAATSSTTKLLSSSSYNLLSGTSLPTPISTSSTASLNLSNMNLKTLPEVMTLSDFTTVSTNLSTTVPSTIITTTITTPTTSIQISNKSLRNNNMNNNSILQRRGSNHSLTLNLNCGSLGNLTKGLSVSNYSLGSTNLHGSNYNLISSSTTTIGGVNAAGGNNVNIAGGGVGSTNNNLNQNLKILNNNKKFNLTSSSTIINNNNNKKNLLQRRGSNASLTLNIGRGSSCMNLNRFNSHSSLNISSMNQQQQQQQHLHLNNYQQQSVGMKKGLLERRNSNASLTLSINNRGLSISNTNLRGSACSLSNLPVNQNDYDNQQQQKTLPNQITDTSSLIRNQYQQNYQQRKFLSSENLNNITQCSKLNQTHVRNSTKTCFGSVSDLKPTSSLSTTMKNNVLYNNYDNNDILYNYGNMIDDNNQQQNRLTNLKNFTTNFEQSTLCSCTGVRNITTKPLSPQSTSEDFKMYLANIQLLQNATNVLNEKHLRKLNYIFQKSYNNENQKKEQQNQRHHHNLLHKQKNIVQQQEQEQQQMMTDDKIEKNNNIVGKTDNRITKIEDQIIDNDIIEVIGDEDDDDDHKIILLLDDNHHQDEGQVQIHQENNIDTIHEFDVPNEEEQKSLLRNLHQEFWDLPTNYQEKPLVFGSQAKNRYKTILPNEHSRVILEFEQNSLQEPYINANFIKGPDYTQNSYIATQGPMQNTIYEYWLMISQNIMKFNKSINDENRKLRNNQKIIMLTNFIENNRQKCSIYFPIDINQIMLVTNTNDIYNNFNNINPDNEFLSLLNFYDKYLVNDDNNIIKINLSEINDEHMMTNKFIKSNINYFILKTYDITIKDGYTIRKLIGLYCYKNFDENKTLELYKFQCYHYWYPDWPDHRSPNDINVLLDMSLHLLNVNYHDYELKTNKLITNDIFYENHLNMIQSLPVVHCSAGIGRTGCLIAILNGLQQIRSSILLKKPTNQNILNADNQETLTDNILLKQFKNNINIKLLNVDILGIVCNLRLQRGGMVQNSEQYELIHRTLCLYQKRLDTILNSIPIEEKQNMETIKKSGSDIIISTKEELTDDNCTTLTEQIVLPKNIINENFHEEIVDVIDG